LWIGNDKYLEMIPPVYEEGAVPKLEDGGGYI
jgi:hypothetical protein